MVLHKSITKSPGLIFYKILKIKIHFSKSHVWVSWDLSIIVFRCCFTYTLVQVQLLFQFSITLVFQLPVKKRGFKNWFLINTTLKNIILACLESSPSKIAGKKFQAFLFVSFSGFWGSKIKVLSHSKFQKKLFFTSLSSLLLFDRSLKNLTIYFSMQPVKSSKHP